MKEDRQKCYHKNAALNTFYGNLSNTQKMKKVESWELNSYVDDMADLIVQ